MVRNEHESSHFLFFFAKEKRGRENVQVKSRRAYASDAASGIGIIAVRLVLVETRGGGDS
jgi:hypothetical protein